MRTSRFILTTLAQTLGIFTDFSSKDEKSEASDDNHLFLTEEDESDDDFELDDESFAEDRDMERQLVKEKIGREELDALSVTSGDGSDSNNGNSSSAGMDDKSIDSRKHRPGRSKRKRYTFRKKIDNGDNMTRPTSPKIQCQFLMLALLMLPTSCVGSAVEPRSIIESEYLP